MSGVCVSLWWYNPGYYGPSGRRAQEESPWTSRHSAARPDYRVDILARRNRVTVSVGDQVLADSERCLVVDEQDHGLVFYFPADDIRLDLFVPDDRTSVCPFKGVATYRRLSRGTRET